jgi:hypothetical protein
MPRKGHQDNAGIHLDPYLRLGAEVMKQALADQGRGDWIGHEAKLFLQGGLAFRWWLDVLGVDEDVFTAYLGSGRQP